MVVARGKLIHAEYMKVEWYEVNTREIFSDLFIYITETLQYMVVILMDPDQSII